MSRTRAAGPEGPLVFQLKRAPRTTRSCLTTLSPSSLLVRSFSGARGLEGSELSRSAEPGVTETRPRRAVGCLSRVLLGNWGQQGGAEALSLCLGRSRGLSRGPLAWRWGWQLWGFVKLPFWVEESLAL